MNLLNFVDRQILFAVFPAIQRDLSQSDAELEELRRSVKRNCPFGSPAWQQRIAPELGLEATLRPQGRPRKSSESRTEPLP